MFELTFTEYSESLWTSLMNLSFVGMFVSSKSLIGFALLAHFLTWILDGKLNNFSPWLDINQDNMDYGYFTLEILTVVSTFRSPPENLLILA